MFIDCHCHLSFPEFSADLHSVIDGLKPDFYAAIESTINLSNTENALKTFADEPLVRFALGFHPYYAAECDEAVVARYAGLIEENKRVVAIGEVGLDYKSEAPLEIQKAAFERFIDLAKELDLALVIHNRGFKEQLLKIVNNISNVGELFQEESFNMDDIEIYLHSETKQLIIWERFS